MTYIELAQEEAAKLGVILTDEAADFLLWEQTAFPCIGEEELRRQVQHAIAHEGWKNFKKKRTGPTAWDKIGGDE